MPEAEVLAALAVLNEMARAHLRVGPKPGCLARVRGLIAPDDTPAENVRDDTVVVPERRVRIAKGAAPNGRAVDAEHGLVLALQPHHVGWQGHHLYDHIGPHDAQRAGFGRTTEMTAAAPDARGIGGVAGQEMP